MAVQEDSPVDVSIVLPTYNESESLPVIIPRIVEVTKNAGIAAEVVVVDDGSPDGTGDVAERLAQQYPVNVIRRTLERGLATAVLTGFAAARGPICIVMDADGSHPVTALPSMVKMIQLDKADIVVGSRNIPGGGSHNWPLFSQLKSKAAASLTFGLTSMTDPTTGFMALRKNLLEGLELDPIGWKIVLEIVVKAAPCRVAEVPIMFEDRELGQSKQSLHVFAQYAEHLLKLYAHRYKGLAELAKFCLIGLAGLFLDLGTVVLTKELTHLDTRLCAVFGFAVAVTANFMLNRKYTFAHGRELPWLFSYLTYAGTNLLGLSVRVGVVHGLMVLGSLDQGHGYVLSNAIGIVLATGFNFIGAKYFAFDPDRLSKANPTKSAWARDERPLSLLLRIASAGLLLVALAYTSVVSIPQRSLKSDDEGVNLTMAKNIATRSDALLHPSVYPGGRGDWLHQDLPALGNTPFYPWLLTLPGARFGLKGMGLIPLLSLWITIAFSALLFAEQSTRSALYSALLLASSRPFLDQALSLEFEPTLTAFCAAGLYFVVRGTRARRIGQCFAGGALLGLGFLTKLWLIAPYALAGCGFALVQTTLARERDEHPLYLRRSLGAAGLGFLLTALAHLAYVALRAPDDLLPWLRNVYLGIFTGQGVTGPKLSVGSLGSRPVGYYPALLYEQYFYLVPLVCFGLPALLRRARMHTIGALAMAFGACMSVVLLSVPAAKEPLYVLAVAPLLYVLAGTCLAELENDSTMFEPANRIIVQTVLALSVGAALIRIGWNAADVASPGFRAALIQGAGIAACALVGGEWLLRRSVSRALLVGCTVSLAGFVVEHASTSNASSERTIADALRPLVADAAPAYPSFIAHHAGLLMGYLDRAGDEISVATLERAANDPAIRAVVVGPDDLEAPRVVSAVGRLKAHCSTQALPAPADGSTLLICHR